MTGTNKFPILFHPGNGAAKMSTLAGQGQKAPVFKPAKIKVSHGECSHRVYSKRFNLTGCNNFAKTSLCRKGFAWPNESNYDPYEFRQRNDPQTHPKLC
jgi:hypothetical protein